MKVQLIVVQGKPEGKVIPLAGPTFKIGRGETCHLRPNSELVSREHAEFSIAADQVTVVDLGSRNGTLVNGKAISGACTLRDQDLVTVGHLTFAVSIQGVPASATTTPSPAGKKAAPEDVSHDDIESWLVADSKNKAPERPSGVYGGDTITISAFKDATAAKPAPAPAKAAPAPAKAAPAPTPAPAPAKVSAPTPTRQPAVSPAPPPSTMADDDSEYERLPEGDGDRSGSEDDDLGSEGEEEGGEESSAEEEAPEEFIDESNPFYVPKKKAAEAAQPTKPQYKDTSDAASDILRKMMERRRGGGGS